jgi:hypothetical protein
MTEQASSKYPLSLYEAIIDKARYSRRRIREAAQCRFGHCPQLLQLVGLEISFPGGIQMKDRDNDNIELVKRIYLAFAQGQIQEMLQMFPDDLDFQHPMPQSIWPWAGSRSGRQGLAEFFAGLNEILEHND